MIKCNVIIRGVVSRAATIYTTKDFKKVANFAIKTTIAGKPDKQVEIFVSHGDISICNSETIAVGKHIEMQGELTFRKKGDNMYLNFTTSSLNPSPVVTNDYIEGTMEFKGIIGKQIDEKTSKQGNKFITFSAYSAEKASNGTDFEYIWVRFVRFSADREAFLQPKTRITAKGALEISAFHDHITLGCRLDSLEERQTLPFSQANTNENAPF